MGAPEIAIVVAVAENGVIGRDGRPAVAPVVATSSVSRR